VTLNEPVVTTCAASGNASCLQVALLLVNANLLTKSEVLNFSHSKDTIGPQKLKQEPCFSRGTVQRDSLVEILSNGAQIYERSQ